MKKDEIDKARAGLVGATGALAPLLAALQQAQGVLDILANAEKHKLVLVDEVEGLKAEVAGTQARVNKLKKQAAEAEAAAEQAEQVARLRTAQAGETAEAAVAQARADMQAQLALLQRDAADKTGAFTAAVADAQQAHDVLVAGLFAKEKDATEAVAAAEKKLKAVQQQAQKVAAALMGE